MGVAVEEQRIPVEDNVKNHSEKEDKNGEEEEETNRSAEPIDAEEPTNKGSIAIINKGQILFSNVEKTHVHVRNKLIYCLSEMNKTPQKRHILRRKRSHKSCCQRLRRPRFLLM